MKLRLHLIAAVLSAVFLAAFWTSTLVAEAFLDAAIGDQQELAVKPTGVFSRTMPMSNDAGLDRITVSLDAPTDAANMLPLTAPDRTVDAIW